MKYIYSIIAILTICVNASVIEAQTQTTLFNRQIPVRIQSVRNENDLVKLVMDFNFSNLGLNTDRSLILTPVLTDKQGNKATLKSVMINGHRRHKAFMRETQLSGSESSVAQNYYKILDLKTDRRSLNYSQTIAYKPWMQKAQLDIYTDLCGCGGEEQQLGCETVINYLFPQKKYRAKVYVAYLTPEVEKVKARSESHDVFLDFPVAKTDIRPQFGNNPQELPKIERIINEIRSDKNLQVKNLLITGYASPEGSLSFNNQLSQGRAEALRNYLAMRVNIPSYMYQVGYGSEDWIGLDKLVQNSYIPQKESVLSIIRYSIGESRKQQLKALEGGNVYQYLLHNLYPQLRRVVARIDYTVCNFDVEEARTIIKTHPRRLSLNEMYIVANTYEEGSDSFIEVFETAVNCFPDDPVANLNSAATALLKQDIVKAESYLKKAKKNTPEYYNNLGVLEMMKKNYSKARGLFERAAEANLKAAIDNQIELKQKEKSGE